MLMVIRNYFNTGECSIGSEPFYRIPMKKEKSEKRKFNVKGG